MSTATEMIDHEARRKAESADAATVEVVKRIKLVESDVSTLRLDLEARTIESQNWFLQVHTDVVTRLDASELVAAGDKMAISEHLIKIWSMLADLSAANNKQESDIRGLGEKLAALYALATTLGLLIQHYWPAIQSVSP